MSAPSKPRVNATDAASEQQVTRRRPDPGALAELFDSWVKMDADEQRDTFAYLRRALDERRPAGAKLFPSS